MGTVTRPTDPGPERRAVMLLGLGAGAALLSGCELNNPFSSARTPAAKAVRDLAPDVATAVRAVLEIRTQADLLTRTVTGFPSLATRFGGLRTLHRVHVDALVAAVPKRVDASTARTEVQPPSDRRNALLEALRGEEGLRDRLDALALDAESGQFARLLGSMGAGIAQYATSARRLAGIQSPLPGPKLPQPASAPDATQALQIALAAEHAAVSVYSYLGAQTSQSRQPVLYKTLEAGYRSHRRQRDQLTVLISGRGGVPTPAAVAYDLPGSARTTAELSDAALQVEHRIATTYGQLVENTVGAERRRALVALDEAAVRQLELRGTPEMFPGSAPRS
jgi:hypothetical protein